jgi:pimeloyl-ACP methyl ester carboxylesterase
MVGNSFHEMLVTDLRPELARITVPVTVLYILPPGLPISAEDMDAFYAAAYANAPNRRLTRIADSNHFIMIDQPVRFEAEVEAFMAR